MHILSWCPVLYQDFQVLTKSRNITQALELLPKIGFLVYQDKTAAAAGFLRMVEGGYAQIDSLISNKDLNQAIRHEALTLLVDSLIEKANALELLGLIAHTSDEGILARAKAIGFKTNPQTVISLSLKNGAGRTR